MKSFLTIIAAATVAFAVSGSATQALAAETMTAEELAKEFKKGSKICSWAAGKKGKDKGTDYYYKDITAMSGNADRVIGKTTLQGKWSVSGDILSLNFGIGEPQKYKLAKIEKKGNYIHALTFNKSSPYIACSEGIGKWQTTHRENRIERVSRSSN